MKTIPRAVATAFVLGLALRLVILWQTGGLGTPIVDEQDYTRLASSLFHGHGFAWASGQPTSLRPPLYPGVLALIWHVAGEGNLQVVRWLQVILSALTSLALYALARQVFDRKVALVAATAIWIYPSLVFFAVTILTETLFTLLVVTFLLATVRLVRSPTPWTALVCGLTLGVAALTRSVLFPMPLLLGPLLLVVLDGRAPRRIMLVGLVCIGFLVPVTPWAIRNTRLQGVPTIIDTMGGINLRMGNYEHTPDVRMWDAVALKGSESWVYGIDNDFTHPPTEGEKDKWAQRKALAYMAAHPGTTMRRSLIKFADFWGIEREFLAGVAQGLYGPPPWFALAGAMLIALCSAIVMAAGGAGLWLAAPERRMHIVLLLPVLLITGIHAIVYGHSRYHVPLVPILAMYATALLVQRGRWSAASSFVRAGAILTVALLVAIWIREIVFVDGSRLRAFFG